MKRSEVTDFILEVRVGLLGVGLESEEPNLPFVIHIFSNNKKPQQLFMLLNRKYFSKQLTKRTGGQ